MAKWSEVNQLARQYAVMENPEARLNLRNQIVERLQPYMSYLAKRLVYRAVSVSKSRYLTLRMHKGMSPHVRDLAQAGTLACIEKFDNYDPEKSCVSTYFSWVAVQAMYKEAVKQHLAKVSLSENGGTIACRMRALEQESSEEDTFSRLFKKHGIRPELARQVANALEAESLDELLEQGFDVAQEQFLDQETDLLRCYATQALQSLDEREKYILQKHLEGIQDTEIAGRFGLTRSRIGQIKASAVRKIRREHGKALKQFY